MLDKVLAALDMLRIAKQNLPSTETPYALVDGAVRILESIQCGLEITVIDTTKRP